MPRYPKHPHGKSKHRQKGGERRYVHNPNDDGKDVNALAEYVESKKSVNDPRSATPQEKEKLQDYVKRTKDRQWVDRDSDVALSSKSKSESKKRKGEGKSEKSSRSPKLSGGMITSVKSTTNTSSKSHGADRPSKSASGVSTKPSKNVKKVHLKSGKRVPESKSRSEHHIVRSVDHMDIELRTPVR